MIAPIKFCGTSGKIGEIKGKGPSGEILDLLENSFKWEKPWKIVDSLNI